MSKTDRELTPRQAAFARGVASGKNATQAAKDAGYSATYANRYATQLLDNPLVRQHLRDLTDAIASPEIALATDRQKFWTTVMRDCGQEMKDRLRASELLGKAQADFVERLEHTGKDGQPLPAPQVSIYMPANHRSGSPAVSVPVNGNGRGH